jgi:hypothetical protein
MRPARPGSPTSLESKRFALYRPLGWKFATCWARSTRWWPVIFFRGDRCSVGELDVGVVEDDVDLGRAAEHAALVRIAP